MARCDGKLKAAGELPAQMRAVYEGPLHEPEPSRPARPCPRCRRRFKPTRTRLVLCDYCFRTGDSKERGAVNWA